MCKSIGCMQRIKLLQFSSTPFERCRDQMLHLAMSVFSPVRDVRMVLNKSTGETRGFAFVHFYSVAEATRVMEVMQVVCLVSAVLLDSCKA